MRVLLTGADGQVGWELQRSLALLGDVMALNRQSLDLADFDRLRTVIRELRPGIIVNAGAYTAVDRAESEEEVASRINAGAPAVMAEEASRLGAWLVHYSTDYVFDGTKAGLYVEDDTPSPLNAYGRSKLEGECAIASIGARYLILRTSWVYTDRGRNFVSTILKLARERSEIKVVDDQVGTPTWARFVAESTAFCLLQLLRDSPSSAADRSGTYHLTCSGETSWFGFAQAILEQAGSHGVRVVPIPTHEYPAAARRPARVVLDNGKLMRTFGFAPVPWRHALRLCLDYRTSV